MRKIMELMMLLGEYMAAIGLIAFVILVCAAIVFLLWK